LLRSEDTFWPGERFLLQADAQGEKPPSRVDVRIEGTDYSTILQFNGDGWSGSLFDEEMIYAFGQEKAETLVFLFSAVIDGVYCQDRCSITVDGRDPYWLMHRKE
jgi:hypothetical protein